MALAASGSTDLVKESSAASAREMRLAGINWVFGPVADINSDPLNPVIGVRSWGDGARLISFPASHASAHYVLNQNLAL